MSELKVPLSACPLVLLFLNLGTPVLISRLCYMIYASDKQFAAMSRSSANLRRVHGRINNMFILLCA